MKHNKLLLFPWYSITVIEYTIYYLSKKKLTGDITSLDKKVCYSVLIICLIIFIYSITKYLSIKYREYKKNKGKNKSLNYK